MNNPVCAVMSLLTKGTMAIISSFENRFYLTRFKSSAGSLIVTCDKAYFLIDSRYFEAAEGAVTSAEVVLLKDFKEQIEEIAKENNIDACLYETYSSTVFERKKLKDIFGDALIDSDILSLKLQELRSIKSPEEKSFIKEAQKACDDAFSHILDYIKEGVSERDTALELEWFIRKKGFGISFDFIVASGENSSVPHAEVSHRCFKKGDFITMDFGAKWRGFCSDMTRTVALGNVSDEMKRVYDIVLKANTEALKSAKAGISGAELDRVARDIIEREGYGSFFGHGLGHGVGAEIHEAPSLSPKENTVLKPGMCVTIEPGIYLPEKFGVRIEDMGFIEENGFDNITKSPKELMIL